MAVRADLIFKELDMNQPLSKPQRNLRATQLNPISAAYYRDRGYSTNDAAKLASLAQERLQIEAAHQKQIKQFTKD
jgi:hypothetical protein